MRITPHFPPGLESLKKSFLGSRRYRVLPPVGSLWSMYNDTLPVALALNTYLKESGPFSMRMTGLEFTATVQFDVNSDGIKAKQLIQELADQVPVASERLAVGTDWHVRIVGLVDGIRFDHSSPMLVMQKRSGLPRISASWKSAFQTLIESRAGLYA